MTNPVYVAIDTTDIERAAALAGAVGPHVGGLKLGLEFFGAHGPDGVRRLSARGLPVFLDLKLHDIPNTVAGAMRGLVRLKPSLTTLHGGGGKAMIEAAVGAAAEAAAEIGVARPRLLAVTVLTSTAESELAGLGVAGSMAEQVKRLAGLAQEAGADGVVASPHEIEPLRRQCGPGFLLVIPGIRPAWAAANDQKRVMTPAEAKALGADILVIGRPITAAADPCAAAQRIVQELE